MKTALRTTLVIAAFAAASLGLSLAVFGTGKLSLSDAATSAAKGGPQLTALPLGDGKTTTTAARRGYLFKCNASPTTGPGAAVDGPWIHGSTYDLTAKYVVDGNVAWPAARFTKKLTKKLLKLRGNGLPGHATGTFPIATTDDAYQVDRNPNSISAQTVSEKLAAHPKRLSKPQCMGGQAGIARNGVSIFNAVDAKGDDAVAHEVQDSCAGHPQEQGQYHYHGLPSCLGFGSKKKHSKLIGWALDGFPIYGPYGDGGDYLSNSELDVCHGTTETLKYQGRVQRIYHYVANYEFPYTVGCFRAKAQGDTGGGGGGAPPTGPPPAP